MSVELIEHNPTFKKPCMLLLSTCASDDIKNRTQLLDAVVDSWEKSWRHTPDAMISILVANKALLEAITVDGEPYQGTLEDIQLDLDIDENAQVTSTLTVTELGQQILTDYAPKNTLNQLLDEKSKYGDVFQVALAACNKEDGCSLSDLEAAINSMPALQPDPKDRQTKVYAQFFIDALESAGAIEWKGAWRTTAAGKDILAAQTAA